MTRRLFLTASYDPQSVVGDALLMMLHSLSEHGDIVFVADTDFPEAELSKVAPHVLHATACRHAEYDFGSYKRAFHWALSNLDLSSYDVVYLVNDSVFGPLSSLGELLLRMESSSKEAFSLVFNPSTSHPHMQSWFIGLRASVFLSSWFSCFLSSVRPLESKEAVCMEYETGLTRLLVSHGVVPGSIFRAGGRGIYNSVRKLNRAGLPFIKKASFVRHCGCLGRQLRLVLDSCAPDVRDAVLSDASRLWGHEYVNELLQGGILNMAGRYLRYLKSKIF